MRGELLQQNQAIEADIQPCFQQAIDVARQQQGHLLELRAVMSLSHLWQTHSQVEAAHDLLAETVKRFGEGFDTPVLQQVARLLDELI